MVQESPLRTRHAAYQAEQRRELPTAAHRPGAATGVRAAGPEIEFIRWGPDDGTAACEVVATLGDLESEYAAIRKGAGLLDSPHRGTLVVTGNDRRDFLNRLLTQELKDLAPGMARCSFLLNRKGRIEADLLLVELGDRVLIDLDVHRVAPTIETLEGFVFTEDVSVTDATSRFHHVAVFGPHAVETVGAAAGSAFSLDAHEARTIPIAGTDVVVARRDLTGAPGLELIVAREGIEPVWDTLLAADGTIGGNSRRIRPVGWLAVNTARIEAGTPLFLIDFGPHNLPHETGLLRQRVSFTKGCYPGQEIVARTENLGRPKQVLVGLRPDGDRLPVAGAEVRDGASDAAVGVVTSSTISPMLGASPIAYAMVKASHAGPEASVVVDAEGEKTSAAVVDLCFLPGGCGGAAS